jgi:cobalt-zinc-cadmium efflux system membrane fusion protein
MNKKGFVLLLISGMILTGGCRHRSPDRANDKRGFPAGGQGQRQRQRQMAQAGPERSAAAGGPARTWGDITAITLTDAERQAIDIETVSATRRALTSALQATGKVLAHQFRKAIVSYAFPARISAIHVRIGEWVEPGQKLVTLQSEEVGKAKSEYYKGAADYELARTNQERDKRLFDRGVSAQKNLLTSDAELKVAEANLNAAEKKLHVLGFTEAEVRTIAETHQINPTITLFAPIAGKVIQNNAVLGGIIDQSSEILTILDPRVLWVDAEVYERDIAAVRKGQHVDVSVPAFPSETFSGRISYISDVLNESTRTITVRTEVENRDTKLKPGMFANIRISLNHQTQALVLPEAAVLDDLDRKMVFVEKDGAYVPRLVTIGIRDDGFLEILSGVESGDKVVAQGNYQLKSKLYDQVLKKAGVH